MKIKITTGRGPWVDGKPQADGAVLDTDDNTAKLLIERGWAEAQRGRPKKAEINDAE